MKVLIKNENGFLKIDKWPIPYGDQFRITANRLNCTIRDAERNNYS